MSGSIRVDVDRLSSVGRDLDGLADVLGGSGRAMSDGDGAVGSGELASALGKADDGWRVHRERLLGDVQGLARCVDGAVRTYSGLETDLSGVIREALG